MSIGMSPPSGSYSCISLRTAGRGESALHGKKEKSIESKKDK